jgi:lipoprotein NlpD
MVNVLCRKIFFVIFILSGLVGCVTGYAPVTDLSDSREVSRSSYNKAPTQRVLSKLPSSYRVKTGDTLYSIAWKYGLDFKQLAKKNDISSNYLIYKGQLLAIKGSSKANRNSKPSLNSSSSSSAKSNSKTRSTTSTQTAENQKNNSSISTNKNSRTAKKPTKKPSKTYSSVTWKWPVESRKHNKFTNENKGIDIPGIKGQNVFSAASGKVVYAGNGIIGYGNLIIIKHSQKYLSAYAHNSVILVKEGELIKVGGKIAEIGNSGTIKTILHFEIRKDGKPVDPLQYLPKN